VSTTGKYVRGVSARYTRSNFGSNKRSRGKSKALKIGEAGPVVPITNGGEGEAVELYAERGARCFEEEERSKGTPDLVLQAMVTLVERIFLGILSEPLFLAENQAPKFKANGVAPPRNAWSKPSGNAGGNTTWGANNNAWSPSEMAESLKSPKDDGTPWNAPGAKDWSQSELGGGSQGDPLSGPGDGGNRPNGKKPGWGETRNPDSGGRGTPPKPQAKPTWGATGAAKDWSPSELALSDSASQCGGGSRIPPGTGPVKKSWADQVEDEFGYADGDEPAPMVAPAPDLEGDGDGDENGWTESNRGKGRGRGKGKGKRRA